MNAECWTLYMDVTDWVQERFGSTDNKTLLDESQYSRKDLRKDKQKLEQNLKKIENDMDKHSERYQKLLQKGAESDEMKQQQYAQKAKFEKKKYQIKKKKYKTQNIKLGTIVSIEGMREVMELHEGTNLALDDLFEDDRNIQELQTQVMDQMAEYGLNLEDMQEVQEALDVEILGQDLDTEASEEIELMKEMEAGNISQEQVDIEEEVDIEDEKIDIDDEIGQSTQNI